MTSSSIVGTQKVWPIGKYFTMTIIVCSDSRFFLVAQQPEIAVYAHFSMEHKGT